MAKKLNENELKNVSGGCGDSGPDEYEIWCEVIGYCHASLGSYWVDEKPDNLDRARAIVGEEAKKAWANNVYAIRLKFKIDKNYSVLEEGTISKF